jgi:hypothetical protein
MTPLEQIIERLNSGIELNENTLNNKLRSNIERNRSSYTLNVLKSFKTQAEEMLKEERRDINKSKKWDELGDEIASCYVDENGDELSDEESEEIDLGTIGEIAATAFGWI